MKSWKILIVEDELIIAKSMQSVLERKGYTIIAIAPSGKKALEAIQNEIPDLVLMDIALKGEIDGITTARTIKRQFGIPFIFITQLTDDQVFENAKETLPQSYITKPFNDNDLYRAIELAIQNIKEKNNGSPVLLGEKVEDGIFIRVTNATLIKLLYNDILYIEANGAYTHIYIDKHAQNKKHNKAENNNFYTISQSSNHVVAALNLPFICKVQRSFYVNIHKIEVINNDELIIQGKTITIGKNYKNELFNSRLNILKNNN